MSNSFQSVFGSGGGGGATLAANTFTGAQTLPAGVGLLPASSGGTNLGQYNLGFGTIRVRTVEAESGSGNSSFYLNQDHGILCGSSGYIGFSNAAASSPTLNDAFFRRSAAASIQMGTDHATTATNQTFKAHNVTNGTAAKLTISGGNAATGTGGAVEIKGGTGTAASGLVLIKDIPTSNPGAGYLWNDAGTLKIGT
jgi:hypothetical protein